MSPNCLPIVTDTPKTFSLLSNTLVTLFSQRGKEAVVCSLVMDVVFRWHKRLAILYLMPIMDHGQVADFVKQSTRKASKQTPTE